MEVNYKECIKRMIDFEEFIHYNRNFVGIQTKIVGYLIYSYSTLICKVNFEKKLYSINFTRYSVTTSKQVNYIRAAALVWEVNGYERIMWNY